MVDEILIRQISHRAKKLVLGGWSQRAEAETLNGYVTDARSSSAVTFSAAGAIKRAIEELRENKQYFSTMEAYLETINRFAELVGEPIHFYNKDQKTTAGMVAQTFTRIIEESVKKTLKTNAEIRHKNLNLDDEIPVIVTNEKAVDLRSDSFNKLLVDWSKEETHD